MADRLTQLQDAIDQMATQFFSSLRYISTHHDASALVGESKLSDDTAPTDPPADFEAAKHELARDLVVKSTQIELLITTLPGIGVSEEMQRGRLARLEDELKEAERERERSEREKGEMLERLEEVVCAIRRV